MCVTADQLPPRLCEWVWTDSDCVTTDQLPPRLCGWVWTDSDCVTAGQLPPMSGAERVALIQQRLRDVQQKWVDLKGEVAYIERKRRRARRKEREGMFEQQLHVIHILTGGLGLSPYQDPALTEERNVESAL